MAKKTTTKETAIFKQLQEIPIVGIACKKVGISRQTFYRWAETDASFKKKIDKALEKGIKNINDLCESQLIRKIDKGNHQAISFWLRNNSKKYEDKPGIIIKEVTKI